MDIVVTSPKDQDIMHKVKDPSNSFWSLKRLPTNFKVGDIVFVVKNNVVIGGFRVRKIVHAKNPVQDAIGHNPSNVWRIWFDALISDDELVEVGVLDKNYNPIIKVKGFQGFRYRWW